MKATVGRPGEGTKRIWWARPRKLCAPERPGGGGRSHRPARREAEIEWLREHGVRLAEGAGALEDLLPLLTKELRKPGVVAVHGNRHPDFVAALCAAHLHLERGVDPAEALARAAASGLMVTPEACALLGVEPAAVTG